MSRSLKFVVVVSLAFGSSILTSAIIAQTRAPKKNPATTLKGKAGSTTERATTTVIDPAAPRAQPVGAKPLLPVASARPSSMKVTTNGRAVSIAFQAELMDERPDVLYLWSLVITNKAVPAEPQELFYNGQIFSVAGKGPTEPSFKEAVTLEPGRYRVEVRLYDVRRNTDLEMLKGNSQKALQSLAIRYYQDVSVTE